MDPHRPLSVTNRSPVGPTHTPPPYHKLPPAVDENMLTSLDDETEPNVTQDNLGGFGDTDGNNAMIVEEQERKCSLRSNVQSAIVDQTRTQQSRPQRRPPSLRRRRCRHSACSRR